MTTLDSDAPVAAHDPGRSERPERPERTWPDVDQVPHRPVRAVIARRLFRNAIEGLPVRVEIESTGEVWGSGDTDSPRLRLTRPAAFFERLGDSGLIGFGEAYMAADLETEDTNELVRALTVLCEHLTGLVPPWIAHLRRLGVRRQPRGEANTPQGSRRNIARHYDLSNDLFASFLDRSMTYSAALFDDGLSHRIGSPPTWADLESAQHNKIDRLLDACGVGPGKSVLEIGTGWGQLALSAARRGANVRSITLSPQQMALAQKKASDAGVGDRVTIELRDYRSVGGTYDAIISVEMIEAVGASYWPTYFTSLHRLLGLGGRVGVQAITMPHDRMLATGDDYTFIHKYVFPGGKVPSARAIHEKAAAAGLDVVDDKAFGIHYAETLRLWRTRFEANGWRVPVFGDDEVFRRMWAFYLAYTEAGFRARYLDVHQFVMSRAK